MDGGQGTRRTLLGCLARVDFLGCRALFFASPLNGLCPKTDSGGATSGSGLSRGTPHSMRKKKNTEIEQTFPKQTLPKAHTVTHMYGEDEGSAEHGGLTRRQI